MHVVLMVGHNKYSKGALNKRHPLLLNEYRLNSRTALQIQSFLSSEGVKATIVSGGTRSQKVYRTNKLHPDIMVSLHLNAYKGYNSNAHGCEVLIQKGDLASRVLAEVLLEKFSSVISTNRGVKQITRKKRGGRTLCATKAKYRVLVEPLFIDGTEGLMMLDADLADNIAMLYAEGILDFIERMPK